jgi:hypothetical protein
MHASKATRSGQYVHMFKAALRRIASKHLRGHRGHLASAPAEAGGAAKISSGGHLLVDCEENQPHCMNRPFKQVSQAHSCMGTLS